MKNDKKTSAGLEMQQSVPPATNPMETTESENLFYRLIRSPKFEDPTKDRIASIQQYILIGLFAAVFGGLVISLISWTGSFVAVGILSFMLLLISIAFYFQRQGHLSRTSWILVFSMYSAFMTSFSSSGFTFPVALQVALVIAVAGMLLQYYSVIGVTAVTIATLFGIPFIVAVPEPLASNSVAYVLIIAILIGALLTISARTLEQTFADLDRGRKELFQSNKDLQLLTSELEQRVAARTKDLATVAEVGTATATVLDTKKLLQAVVEITKERFNLYHSHIYLLDEKGENLVLAAGAGEPGRIMTAEKRSIPLDREQSLVARAARERKGVIVNDVTQAPDFLPNPLLPDTRSELAVPMIVGGNVIGVFDIQSEQIGRFTNSDIDIQTTLAAQLATSIQNVRTYEQTRKQAEFESMVNLIGQKIQQTTSVEETLQAAIREIGLALGASRVSADIGASIRYGKDEVNNN